MRTIDADALKEAFADMREGYPVFSDTEMVSTKDIASIIDNAPTAEITEEQAIDKLHETGWLVKHDKEMTERPQGEWIFKHNSSDVWCSNCDISLESNCCEGVKFSYCPYCGADMRGGENV